MPSSEDASSVDPMGARCRNGTRCVVSILLIGASLHRLCVSRPRYCFVSVIGVLLNPAPLPTPTMVVELPVATWTLPV